MAAESALYAGESKAGSGFEHSPGYTDAHDVMARAPGEPVVGHGVDPLLRGNNVVASMFRISLIYVVIACSCSAL